LHLTPTLLGTVQDVRGATVSVALDDSTLSGLSFINGEGYRVGQIGSFVKIPIGYTDLFGVVSQVGAGAVPERIATVEPFGRRWLTVQIVGESRRGSNFARGVSQHPTIGDEVHLVTTDDLARLYGRPDEPRYARIGHVASAESIPALIDLDRLLTRHSAIVGATGAGKSTTVAGLLNSLSNSALFPSARVVLVDIHGEYASALGNEASVFRLAADSSKQEMPLFVPYWALSLEEMLQVSFGGLDDAARGAVAERIREMKVDSFRQVKRKGLTEDSITAETPIPFSIHQLWLDLTQLVASTHTVQSTGQSLSTQAFVLGTDGKPVQPGDALKAIPPKYRQQNLGAGEKVYLSGSTLNIRRPLEALGSRLRDPQFDFLFKPGPWLPQTNNVPAEDLDSLLEAWLGNEKPVVILDMSGVPSSILNVVVGGMLRVLFDALFWSRKLSEGGRERPVLLVLEEAHAYLATDNPASQTIKRIAKEGRKYGLGLMVVSQRPSEIDPTILSQCGTMLAMRLSNSTDRAHIASAVMDNFSGLLESLPMLRIGEAIVLGEAVHLPMRAMITPPPLGQRPDSHDPRVYVPETEESGPELPGGWNRKREPGNYEDVVEVWRRQRTRSPKTPVKE
jgi:uncharacterized protein